MSWAAALRSLNTYPQQHLLSSYQLKHFIQKQQSRAVNSHKYPRFLTPINTVYHLGVNLACNDSTTKSAGSIKFLPSASLHPGSKKPARKSWGDQGCVPSIQVAVSQLPRFRAGQSSTSPVPILPILRCPPSVVALRYGVSPLTTRAPSSSRTVCSYHP